MSDPVTLGLASTAVAMVNGTIGLLKEAREAAKRSDDHELKDTLSDVFDSVLELKETIGKLRDENAELLKRLQTRALLKWDSSKKLYFADGDPDPFCPACMDSSETQIRLQPRFISGQHWDYDCKVCKSVYAVIPRPTSDVRRINPNSPWL